MFNKAGVYSFGREVNVKENIHNCQRYNLHGHMLLCFSSVTNSWFDQVCKFTEVSLSTVIVNVLQNRQEEKGLPNKEIIITVAHSYLLVDLNSWD